jgi:hypothetical protein
VPERKTAEAIAGELAELQPSAQCLLINALGARHDGAGVEIVKNACKSHNVPVKHAALSALGRIGDESCVALLIEHAAIESLTNLAGENINATLVDRLRDGTSAEKVTICRALLARNAAEAAPALVDVAKTGNSSARAEALKALHSLASRQEVPALVDLIFTVEPTQADQVGKAIATVGRQPCSTINISNVDFGYSSGGEAFLDRLHVLQRGAGIRDAQQQNGTAGCENRFDDGRVKIHGETS